MAVNYTRAGSALGAGMIAQAGKNYEQRMNYKYLDLVLSAVLAGAGYMLSEAPGMQRNIGEGLVDGAAAYLGVVATKLLSAATQARPVQVSVPEPRPQQYHAAARTSILEI